MNRVCPECGKTTEWEKLTRTEEFEIKDEKIVIEMNLLKCPECGAEFEDMNSGKDPYNLAYEEYRRRKGMVFPSQIVEFRKKYNLTQKELSNLLGFGDVTLSRYENGSLQDVAHDQLIKFAMQKENLLGLIKQKPDVFSIEKRNELIERLEKEVTSCSLIEKIFGYGIPNTYSGNKTFDLNRVINLIKSFTYPDGEVKSKLLKLLFYADFSSFKITEVSITGLKYAHLPFGPVPDQYDYLLGAIQKIDEDIKVEIQPIGDYFGEIFISHKPPEPGIFTEENLRIIKFIDNHFREFTAKYIEDFSHEEKGYKETKQGEMIPYTYAEDLQI